MADPPMLGSLLLEGIWSCFFPSGWREGEWGEGLGSHGVLGEFLRVWGVGGVLWSQRWSVSREDRVTQNALITLMDRRSGHFSPAGLGCLDPPAPAACTSMSTCP